MTFVLAYDAAAGAGGPAARDVFVQLDALETALAGMGGSVVRLPVGLDLAAAKSALTAARAPFVVNLVESLDGSDRLQALFAMLLEDLGVPFTGSGSRAMILSNHKVQSKTVLGGRGIPFPGCCWLERTGRLAFLPEDGPRDGLWIVKPLEAHASLHLDDGSVGDFFSAGQLAGRLLGAKRRHGVDFFAERFIDGREFNLSLVEDEDGVRALPPAEIAFVDFPSGKPKIVGHAAKWDEDSEEYAKTPRRFGTLGHDPALKRELIGHALAAWDAFGLAGYARIDFRVDAAGRPFVLEANANPCLSPDAGLAAAAVEAGWTFRDLCAKIVKAGGEGRALAFHKI